MKHTLQVHVQHQIPRVLGISVEFSPRRASTLNSRVVARAIQAAKGLDRRTDQTLHLAARLNVGVDADRFASRGFDQIDCLATLPIKDIPDDDLRAALRNGECAAPANTGGGTRYERYSPVEHPSHYSTSANPCCQHTSLPSYVQFPR